jgi:hypothetical protein
MVLVVVVVDLESGQVLVVLGGVVVVLPAVQAQELVVDLVMVV